ncbi:MAG TPA: CoF synthetase, partial [Myxococcota bacterium]|nr:CoF synthetase [Myxococcota bacterium]
TAFALDALFGQEGRAQVGPDSLVMVTGGFKGRRVRLDAPELYREIGRRLGSPRVVGEYGMTELSSQLWTDPVPAGELPGAFVAPPWMRIYTVDPATGAPLSEGEVGQLRFVDLANYWSVLAIETMDLGRVVPHSEGDRVWLHGRLQGAEVRGCSLSVEELLGLSSATE